MLDQADLELLSESLISFADDARATLFGDGGAVTADGDLDEMDGLFERSATMGLVGDPCPGSDNHELSVWGSHVHHHGARLSLLTLGVLGEACAGLAACVHAQGIGCLALDGWADQVPGDPPFAGGGVAAVFVPSYGVLLDPRTAHDAVDLVGDHDAAHLVGASPFVWAGRDPGWLAVVARHAPRRGATDPSCWSILALPATAEGIVVEPLDAGIGVRAMHQRHVHFDRAPVGERSIVASGHRATRLVTRVVACDWLGLAAIALGSARRAVIEARSYAHERRQGGGAIVEHAAVRLLLAEAEDALAVMQALVGSRADEPLADIDDAELLRWAISSRLSIGTHAQRAVTCCVQVLGGYGYMDDYGMSKRLRDVAAMRARHGSREQLLLLLESLRTDGRR